MKQTIGFIALSVSLLSACAPQIQRATIPTQWIPSPNFGERRPNFVIIHHTIDETLDQALRTLINPHKEVSSHYLIGRDGAVYQLVDERARAWHAGDSLWGSDRDLNSSSIGIELDNNGEEPFADKQISSLLALLKDLRQRYAIPSENFLGHADIAPRRKNDPSRYFPWKLLAQQGFGRWCDKESPDAPPTSFNALLGLRALGYDIGDANAAITAFKRHFTPDDIDTGMTDYSRRVLYCLVQIPTNVMR